MERDSEGPIPVFLDIGPADPAGLDSQPDPAGRGRPGLTYLIDADIAPSVPPHCPHTTSLPSTEVSKEI